MNTTVASRSPAYANPEPRPGFREQDFRKICANGFGDGYNAYAYSMAWFNGHLFVGTGRANLHLLRFAMPHVKIDVWPVECSHPNYSPEFEREAARGEIWSYHPPTDAWSRVYRSPLITDAEGVEFSRELGYRGMAVFQSSRESAPALYATSWSRSRSEGPDLLRSYDGQNFEVLPKPKFKLNLQDVTITAIRTLVPFKGRLFTAPTGGSKGHVNGAGVALVYVTEDPGSGTWIAVNEPFGSISDVATVYELVVLGDYLYAGTGGLAGFQVWRTNAEGSPPYRWEKVLDSGAGRGALNQGAVSMMPFRGALYIGTGIQNGGYDWRFKIGPAAAEIIRLNVDGSWDIIVGNARDGKQPLSGLLAGFNNFFSGYVWRMGVYDGWLYAGTMDWSTILQFTNLKTKPTNGARIIAELGVEDFVRHRGGFELWRTCDGENWLPVTRGGFGNPLNYGCRNIVTTPHGLFIGTANPFGPRLARRVGADWQWSYQDNPLGGLEVWLAKETRHPPPTVDV